MSHSRNLQVHVATSEGREPVCPWGGTAPICNDNFEGTLFFAHRPPPNSGIPFAYDHLIVGKGSPDWLWEIQCQGRFKTPPRGPVWLTVELRDAPMRLGLLTRSFCRAILQFVRFQAKRRNCELRFSFGERAGEKPSIHIPILALDRIFVSDTPTALPAVVDETQGTWRRTGSGEWQPTDRSAIDFASQYVTFAFGSTFLDWSSWQVASVPGIGHMSLETFWGKQGLWVVLSEEETQGASASRRVFAEFELAAPKSAGTDPGKLATLPAGEAVGCTQVDALVEGPPDNEEEEAEAEDAKKGKEEQGDDFLECTQPRERQLTPYMEQQADFLCGLWRTCKHSPDYKGLSAGTVLPQGGLLRALLGRAH